MCKVRYGDMIAPEEVRTRLNLKRLFTEQLTAVV